MKLSFIGHIFPPSSFHSYYTHIQWDSWQWNSESVQRVCCHEGDLLFLVVRIKTLYGDISFHCTPFVGLPSLCPLRMWGEFLVENPWKGCEFLFWNFLARVGDSVRHSHVFTAHTHQSVLQAHWSCPTVALFSLKHAHL
jgi:hypothetical protein